MLLTAAKYAEEALGVSLLAGALPPPGPEGGRPRGARHFLTAEAVGENEVALDRWCRELEARLRAPRIWPRIRRRTVAQCEPVVSRAVLDLYGQLAPFFLVSPVASREPGGDRATRARPPLATAALPPGPRDAGAPVPPDVELTAGPPVDAASNDNPHPDRPRAPRVSRPRPAAAVSPCSLSVQARSGDDVVLAEVYLGRVRKGQTPLHLEGLSPGPHEVLVKSAGYA